jgi:hypothetical protein
MFRGSVPHSHAHMRCRICNFRARFTLIRGKPDVTRGLPRSARATRIARTLPFRRWYIICVCSPSRSTTDHTPFWIGPVKRFGPASLTTVRRQFRCLSPAIQPSASANAFIAHTHFSREDCVPSKGGYINGALFTRPLPVLQSSFGYEMQTSRFGRRTRRTIAHTAFAALPN